METPPTHQILFQEQIVKLYNDAGEATWNQNSLKNEIDIAVIHAPGQFERFEITGVNVENQDIPIEIGSDVFILGYPLGFSHFMGTPIWKRGSIASEPHLMTQDSKRRVVLDATTRMGMSGGPVIMRENALPFRWRPN
jgi:hypothetical protein